VSLQAEGQLDGEPEGRDAVLEHVDGVDVVPGDVLEGLRAVYGRSLSGDERAVLAGALAAHGEVGQSRVLHVCEQVEPVVGAVAGVVVEGDDCAPLQHVVVEAGNGAVGGGGQEGGLDLDADQCGEEGEEGEEERCPEHVGLITVILMIIIKVTTIIPVISAVLLFDN
jgi:hypothetical protein